MRPYDPLVLAGGFPPGLNTTLAPTELGPDETPDGYGFNLSADGRLASGTIPTGTSRIATTFSVGSSTYYWHYNRLWRASTNNLIYGAKDYQDVYYPQGLGKITFDEDAQNILGFIPFGFDSLFVIKSTGSYVLSGISDTRGFWTKSDIIQEMATSAIANAGELDGAIYVSNSNGLFAYVNGQVKEITRRIRNSQSGLTSQALTFDYQKKRVICGSVLVYEPGTDKLFKYSGSSFLYTSRQIHNPDYSPFVANDLYFVVEHNTADDGTLTYAVKWEDDDWSDTYDVNLTSAQERYTIQQETLQTSRSARRFQIKITALSSNKYIREIRMSGQQINFEGYST